MSWIRNAILGMLMVAGSAQAIQGPYAGQVAVSNYGPSASWANIATTNDTVQEAFDWLDVAWNKVTFSSAGFSWLDPTNDTLQALGTWIDSNWVTRASQIGISTSGWAAISTSGTNVQAALSAIDSNLVALGSSTNNPKDYQTSTQVLALVTAQPQAILFRDAGSLDQVFTGGAAETEVRIVGSATPGADAFIEVTNGVVFTHTASTDTLQVPTSGWYLVVGSASGKHWGNGSYSDVMTMDLWVTRDGSRDSGGSVFSGARFLGVSTPQYGSDRAVQFSISGSALVYAPTNNTFALSSVLIGSGTSSTVTRAGFELRRMGP
jgi:hypothetical protein